MEEIRRLDEALEKETASPAFIKRYQAIRKKYPVLAPFPLPQGLIAFLHDRKDPSYSTNDQIYRALISEFQSHFQAEAIGAFCLVLLRPGLQRVFHIYRRRLQYVTGVDEADLWLQIRKEALEVLRGWDLAKAQRKIPSGIIGHVSNRIRTWYRALEKEQQAVREFHRERITIDEEDFSASGGWIAEAQEILDELVDLRILSETDRYILLGTALYGRPMESFAKELKGLSYAGIRQRKSRAARALKAYLTHQAQELAERRGLSPDEVSLAEVLRWLRKKDQ